MSRAPAANRAPVPSTLAPVAPMTSRVSSVRSAAAAHVAGSHAGSGGISPRPAAASGVAHNKSPGAQTKNPKATAGLLRPLEHVSEIRVASHQASFTPRDPLLRELENQPAMPIYEPHQEPQLNMPETARAAFKAGKISAGERELNLPETGRAAFEGGVIRRDDPEDLHLPDTDRARFEGGRVGVDLPNAERRPAFEGGIRGSGETREPEKELRADDGEALNEAASSVGEASKPEDDPGDTTQDSFSTSSAERQEHPADAQRSSNSSEKEELDSMAQPEKEIDPAVAAATAAAKAARDAERDRQLAGEVAAMKAKLAADRDAQERTEADRLAAEAAKNAALDAEIEAEKRRRREQREAEEAARFAVEEDRRRQHEEEDARRLAEVEREIAELAARKEATKKAAAEKASAEARDAADRAERARQAEAERIAEEERRQREWVEQQLRELEAARLATLAEEARRLQAERDAAEAQLRLAVEDDERRKRDEAAQKQRDLADAAKYQFRAEALPNSYLDLRLQMSCLFDSKAFATSALAAAFAADSSMAIASAVATGTGGGGTSLAHTSLRPYVELLCLRSNKVMVTPVVWKQLLDGAKAEEAARAAGLKGSAANENVVIAGNDIWLVAERCDPCRVGISPASTTGGGAHQNLVDIECRDVLVSIQKLCFDQYLRPVLVRLMSRRPDGPPVVLAEFGANLRMLESSVVGSKSVDDPNGAVRTEEFRWELLPQGGQGSALGSCLLTQAQELVYHPFDQLLEKMTEKAAKRNSGGKGVKSTGALIFPKHCKMQLMLSGAGLRTDADALHVFVALYRAEKEDTITDADAPHETDGSAPTVANKSHHLRASSPSSMIMYGGRVWSELHRTNVVSFDEFPEFARVTLELDELRRNVKASVLVVVYNAGYLGGAAGSPPPALNGPAPLEQSLTLEKCTILGGVVTSVQAMCQASGEPAATSKKAADPPPPKEKLDRKKIRRNSNGPADSASHLLQLDLVSFEGGVKLIHRGFGGDGLASISKSTTVALKVREASPAAGAGSLTLSRVSLFSPSTQLEDVERAERARAKKLAKLAEAREEAARKAEAHADQAQAEAAKVREELQQRREEIEQQLRTSGGAAALMAKPSNLRVASVVSSVQSDASQRH